MTEDLVLLVGLCIPLGTAVLVAALGRWPNLREAVSIAGGVALVACSAILFGAVSEGHRPTLALAEPLPGIAIQLVLEPLGAVFACLASFLWVVTTVYAIGYMRGHREANQTRFFACFAVAMSAVFGAACAGNLVTLFVFYELLTLSTWPLVVHSGDQRALRAGRVYLGILLGSSIGLLLFAIVWTHVIAGRGDFEQGGLLAPRLASGEVSPALATVLFTLFAFGIGKAALMPLHRWLPAAMVAPTPVSALLHAVAVVKTGVFALLKVVVYVFGIDGLQATGAALPVVYIAGFTMLAASAVALTRTDLKERLAYSTVAQLGIIVAGSASATAEGVVGAGLHMVTHAFGKITLFFVAGTVLVAAHRTQIPAMAGLGRALPFTFGAFGIAALSVVGVPPLVGAWSKWWIGMGLTPESSRLVLGALLVSSLLSAGYLLPIAFRAFAPGRGNRGTADSGTTGGDTPPVAAPPVLCVVAMGISAAGCVGIALVLDPLQRLLGEVVR